MEKVKQAGKAQKPPGKPKYKAALESKPLELKPFMKPREAAMYTGIALSAIYAGIKRGEIAVYKSGNTNYIDMAKLCGKCTPPGESVPFLCADAPREQVG